MDLLECTSCNKILCRHCQDRIFQKSMVGTSLEDMVQQEPELDESSNGKVCPSCMDGTFSFQYIKSKIVKSLLANLKVNHKCSSKEPIKYKYDDLKRHLLSECDHFQYECRLCAMVVNQRSEEHK